MTPSLRLARMELELGARSPRTLLLLGAFAALSVAVGTLGINALAASDAPRVTALATRPDYVIAALVLLVAMLGPAVPLMAVADAVATARERGVLRVLLAQPMRRRSVVLGMFLGRGGPAALTGAAGVLVGVAAGGIALPAPVAAQLAALVGLLFLAYAAWGMLVGSAARSSGEAIAAGLGAWFVFYVLWGLVLIPLESLATGSAHAAPLGVLGTSLNPTMLFEQAVLPLLPEPAHLSAARTGVVALLPTLLLAAHAGIVLLAAGWVLARREVSP